MPPVGMISSSRREGGGTSSTSLSKAKRSSAKKTASSGKKGSLRSSRREASSPRVSAKRNESSNASSLGMMAAIGGGILFLVLIAVVATRKKEKPSEPVHPPAVVAYVQEGPKPSSEKSKKTGNLEYWMKLNAENPDVLDGPIKDEATARQMLAEAKEAYNQGEKAGGAERNRLYKKAHAICADLISSPVSAGVREEARKIHAWSKKLLTEE